MNKPTIFITVNRAIIARNLLLTDFIGLTSDSYDVILVSSIFGEEFKSKFSQYRIIELYKPTLSKFKMKLQQLIVSIGKGLIYNPTIELRTRYGMLLRNEVKLKYFRYLIQKYILGKLLRFECLRTFVRWIDAKCFSCNLYDDVIKKYQPVALFATAINGEEDVLLVRNCKKYNIPTIGMVKSWDNCSKFAFREKTDELIVWGEYMKEEALLFQGYKDNNVHIVGVPQFDFYKTISLPTKEDFCKMYNLDINKKIIFIGSEGPVNEEDHIVPFLKKKIVDGTLKNYQILIRPHFSYRQDKERFLSFVDNKIVFLDGNYQYSNSKDGIELSVDAIIRMMCQIRYSDVLITGASTLALDIMANGKPVILYSFDKDNSVPYFNSVKRFYNSLWFKEIKKMGLNNMVYSYEELLNKLIAFGSNVDVNLEKIDKLIEHFCYKIDGKSASRVAKVVDNFISRNITWIQPSNATTLGIN